MAGSPSRAAVALSPRVVSVMMPAWNAARHVGEAIESVQAQSYPSWNLIVVDDGSTDGTAAIAAGYQDPRLRLVRRDNGGEGAARNSALDLVTGEFLAFLDADDVWLPDHLEQAVRYLEAHPGDIGVYSDGVHITDGGRRLRPLSARRRPPATGRIFDDLLRGPDLLGPPVCVVLRSGPVRAAGLRFDESLRIGTDWDFFTRVAAIGTFGYVDRQTCLYRVHSGSVTAAVGLDDRLRQLARCRINAIGHPAFARCPVEVRIHVLYELLAVLLRDAPDEQAAIVASRPFSALPRAERARLLRLMASKAILHGGSQAWAAQWLRESRRIAPTDPRGAVVSGLHRLSPAACRALLRWWTGAETDPRSVPPFADLQDDLRETELSGPLAALPRSCERPT